MTPDLDLEYNLNYISKKKVAIEAIEVSNNQTDPFCNSHTEQHLQNIESVESIVDELQERFRIPIRGWNRNILIEMAWLHSDKRKGFTAPTIKTLNNRLKMKKIMMNGKPLNYNNLRKKIKRLHEKGLITCLPEKDGHAYQYALANMQNKVPLRERNKRVRESQSHTIDETKEAIKEDMLYQILVDESNKDKHINQNSKGPELEFHHIQLKSQLRQPHEFYEQIKKNINWNPCSDENKGLKYEGRISRHRTFTVMIYPNGTVIIMIGCTNEPFRWFPREDWLSFYETCSSIHQLLRDSLDIDSSDPLVHTSYLDWKVTQLHLGYDYQIYADYNKKDKWTKKLDIARFNDDTRVRNLDGVACQVYTKRLPHKGKVIRIEEHLNFSDSSPKSDSSNLFDILPSAPSVKSLKDIVKPKSITEILSKF